MSEPPGEDVFVVRSVTVSEVMDADGELWITLSSEGEPTIWQQIGMFEVAGESLRIAAREMWAEG